MVFNGPFQHKPFNDSMIPNTRKLEVLIEIVNVKFFKGDILSIFRTRCPTGIENVHRRHERQFSDVYEPVFLQLGMQEYKAAYQNHPKH